VGGKWVESGKTKREAEENAGATENLWPTQGG